jgi:hypothetical protein
LRPNHSHSISPDLTVGKTNYVMMVLFLHADKYDRIPEGFTPNLKSKIAIESSSDYEAVIFVRGLNHVCVLSVPIA